ncbi:MAG: HlyD family secretion protein, partial [Acidimicrobiaceae bacterium]
LQHDQQTIHTAQAKVDTDRANMAAAQASASTTSATVDQASIDTARAGVIQAQASVDNAQKALDATTLSAPSDGAVSSITKAVGDSVSASSTTSSSTSSSSSTASASTSGTGAAAGGGGATTASTSSASTAAFTIVQPNAFEVKVAFPESDAVKVKVGQATNTTLDALTGTTFAGTVTSVESAATVTSNVVTYNAVVSVTGAPSTARPGMTANVTVTTVAKDNVVEIATAAVQTQAGASYVNRLANGQIVRTDVTTGLQGDSNTEIVSGLSAGDQVVVSTGTVATAATGNRTATGAGTLGGTGGAGGPGGGGGFPGGGGAN